MGHGLTLGDNRIQGRDGLKKLLLEDKQLYDKLMNDVLTSLGVVNSNSQAENVKEKKK